MQTPERQTSMSEPIVCGCIQKASVNNRTVLHGHIELC